MNQREKIGNTLGRKEESNTTIKTSNTTRGDESEGSGERRKTKNIPRQDQTIQTKQDVPKQRKKILSTCKGENAYQQPDDKKAKQLWDKIWKQREHNR